MNKYLINNLILFIFSLNILTIVFIGNSNPILDLFNKLIAIAGLAWLFNYYYKTLNLNNNQIHNHFSLKADRIVVKDDLNSQFSSLIDASFALIKDISHDFEVGIYFYQPDSKLL